MKQIQMLDLQAEYAYMKNDIDAAIARCLSHQQWILGPEVKELEAKVAEYLGVKSCVGVSSGTEALVVSLRALAIKLTGKEYFDRNDQIVTTPFTFTATGDAILRSGATPVFIDIDPATYNIDVKKLSDYLRADGSKVKGIIPVHLYGQSCDMDKVMELADAKGLFVVEDVAQAIGGEWKGRKLGSIGSTGAFSFFPSKNLGCFGDGGMVATNDTELAELLRMLLKHGGRDKYNVDHVGYNARLDTLQAAVLVAKLRYLDEFNSKRRHIASAYDKGLGSIVKTPVAISGAHHVYHQYTISVEDRDAVQKSLKDDGIATMVYYPVPLDRMKVFEGRCIVPSEPVNARKASESVISLPMEPLSSDEDVECVIKGVRKALGAAV